MSDKDTSLILRNASEMVLSKDATPKEAGQRLLALPTDQRALVIGNSFAKGMEGVSAKSANEAEAMAERFGRRIEAVLDELPTEDFKQTLHELIEKGDTEIVLQMIAGRAGEFSSTSEHLTAELIAEFFERDPDMHRDEDVVNARLINVAWTFLMETPENCQGVNTFFFFEGEGQNLTDHLTALATAGNEDAAQICQNLENRKRLQETLLETEDSE